MLQMSMMKKLGKQRTQSIFQMMRKKGSINFRKRRIKRSWLKRGEETIQKKVKLVVIWMRAIKRREDIVRPGFSRKIRNTRIKLSIFRHMDKDNSLHQETLTIKLFKVHNLCLKITWDLNFNNKTTKLLHNYSCLNITLIPQTINIL